MSFGLYLGVSKNNMAKKKKNSIVADSKNIPNSRVVVQSNIVGTANDTLHSADKATTSKNGWSIFNFKLQAIIVAALAFIFYINSSVNEFAHDDGIVIVKNEYVQEGFAGIGKILTKDAYDSYYRQLNTGNQLSGGRYRPLSIITFAIEQEFFGAVPVEKVDSFLHLSLSYGVRGPAEQKLVHQMQVRHVFNVLWYMLLVVVLLYFLRYIVFPTQPIIAFLAAILFTIHPIHTEVVANVKSRDEIMSLLFMCLTFIFAFKYQEQKKWWQLLVGLLSFFLAFLSKEYAITLVFLLPFSFYLFKDYTIKKSILSFLPFSIVVFVYLYIRLKIAIITAVGEDSASMSFEEIMKSIKNTGSSSEKEILNNPYFYATQDQKLATEIATSLNYIKLLLFPFPLSADYSYNTIPYKDFGNVWVYISMLVHTALITLIGYFGFIKKNFKVLSFAIAFYMVHLLLVNNIIFDIGATMGERLIFHSSVGFSIVVAFFMYKAMEKIQPVATGRIALIAVVSVITIIFGFTTINRNADWKNDDTLFSADIKTTPNSILVNANVAAAIISKADYEKDDKIRKEKLLYGIQILDNAIALHKHTFVAGFLNRGIAWFKFDYSKKQSNWIYWHHW